MAESHAVVLSYPLHGRFLVKNSPANRVPSHGTDQMGTTYAIDLIPVDDRGRSAAWQWKAFVIPEPPEHFRGFGQSVMAPCAGRVVVAHDGEADHQARRSPVTALSYLAGQASRAAGGAAALAGNHVVVAQGTDGPFVLVAHLRRGSICVDVGEHVAQGQPIGECGNSGNSTQPHVHVQATDTTDWPRAKGLPLAFHGPEGPELPANGAVITDRADESESG